MIKVYFDSRLAQCETESNLVEAIAHELGRHDYTVDCPSCSHGLKICPSCDGSGAQDCFGCLGTGEVVYGESCEYCGGDGEEDCEECEGIGDVHCHRCDGGGRVVATVYQVQVEVTQAEVEGSQ